MRSTGRNHSADVPVPAAVSAMMVTVESIMNVPAGTVARGTVTLSGEILMGRGYSSGPPFWPHQT